MTADIMGRKVGGLGYGLMGKCLTWRAKPPSDEQAFAAMRASLETGCNFWNGGEFYGPPERNSLVLLNRYYEKYPEDAAKVLLSVKGALSPSMAADSSPEGVRKSVETSLKQLGGRGKIDIFECARKQPDVPIETTMKALAGLVEEGKIGGVALSEVNADTIRAAAKVTKIVAVETELSLFSTEPLTNGIADACAELKIPLVAYSPMGRGMLTGQVRSFDDLPEGDFRRFLPRFQPENFDVNMKLVEEVERLAKKKGCTPAQLAIGWVLNLSEKDGRPQIIPIPGATTPERVKENSVQVKLSDEEMKELDSVLANSEVKGDRYHEHGMTMVDK